MPVRARDGRRSALLKATLRWQRLIARAVNVLTTWSILRPSPGVLVHSAPCAAAPPAIASDGRVAADFHKCEQATARPCVFPSSIAGSSRCAGLAGDPP